MDQYLNRGTEWERDEDLEGDPRTGRGMGRGVSRETSVPAQPEAAEPNDLTLGMTALLGIFVAVVLVCAVFFGFGYSTGRTLHGAKAAPAASPASAPNGSASVAEDGESSAPESDAPSSAAGRLTAAPVTAKPSAGAPVAGTSMDAAGADDPSVREARTSASGEAAIAPGHRNVVPAASLALPAASAGSGAEAGGVMVQIAAVAHQGDADMLATALRGNGYAAIVRTEPQDRLLHVQIGPFATRDQARSMRARLQSAGYNAFLKP